MAHTCTSASTQFLHYECVLFREYALSFMSRILDTEQMGRTTLQNAIAKQKQTKKNDKKLKKNKKKKHTHKKKKQKKTHAHKTKRRE